MNKKLHDSIFYQELRKNLQEKFYQENNKIFKEIDNENIVSIHNKIYDLYLPVSELDKILPISFAGFCNKLYDLHDNISEWIIVPILKGGIYTESYIKKFAFIHFMENEFIHLSSYIEDAKRGKIRTRMLPLVEKIKKRHVILLDEIIESGEQLSLAAHYIWQMEPLSINAYIPINKLESKDKEQELKDIFLKKYRGIFSAAIEFPYNCWAAGTFLGLDSGGKFRATNPHLYVERVGEVAHPYSWYLENTQNPYKKK